MLLLMKIRYLAFSFWKRFLYKQHIHRHTQTRKYLFTYSISYEYFFQRIICKQSMLNYMYIVKFWFTTMFLLTLIQCQIWLYFVQSFPCIFVGFNVRVECESLVKTCEESEVCDCLMSEQPTKGHMRNTC